MSIHLLIVDDNRDLLNNLREFFEMQGYAAEGCETGPDALDRIRRSTFDLIVLDVGLPGLDGLSLCRTLREEGLAVPVLMLSARKAIDDRVVGLENGADDYLVKPFSLRELKARVEALLRRARSLQTTLRVGDLELDLAQHRVLRAGRTLKLTPMAERLLAELMRASPSVVERRRLEERIWGGAVPNSDSLRANLYLLRQVVDKPFATPLIHTHAGIGWSISTEAP